MGRTGENMETVKKTCPWGCLELTTTDGERCREVAYYDLGRQVKIDTHGSRHNGLYDGAEGVLKDHVGTGNKGRPPKAIVGVMLHGSPLWGEPFTLYIESEFVFTNEKE
jgi:hypothetical protein